MFIKANWIEARTKSTIVAEVFAAHRALNIAGPLNHHNDNSAPGTFSHARFKMESFPLRIAHNGVKRTLKNARVQFKF